MTGKPRFPSDILAGIDQHKGLRIRAGLGPHRFIGIWAVVVNERLFVRSWSLKAGGWYRTFLAEPRGAIQIGEREIAVRAIHTKAERVKQAVDRAYLDKYSAPGSIKYARDLTSRKCREATLELLPRPCGKA